ncbi:MAG: ATP-binding sugar transporter from pro-phage [Eubacterium sp.]|jgi:hypothetical protein|nr:ATP-binding sugar transporter from pro-phage [Eubacterium sp.]
MSSFKDMVEADNKNVFMNTEEFAELHTVIYDGMTYDGEEHQGISITLSGLKEKDRRQLQADHVEGLYLVTTIMHCAASDLGGVVPEKGTRIKINDGDFFREYHVAASVCEVGMLRVELEAIDE